ncbi:uncharacterized protein EV154DRAFT_401383, partial [Mucor mucedo]|uniref:uncharacterized protein n=1 Tax=Mucor mucedo TaxID=29922 RepID=UPI002220E07C
YWLISLVIAYCAVIGIYDSPQATDLPRAYMSLQGKIQLSKEVGKQIMQSVTDQVVPYEQIHSIRFIDAILKSPADKILRRVLRD